MNATMSGDGKAPVRLGVLGCADIAWRRTLPAAVDNPALELVAVASRAQAKAERFAERFGCEAVTGYERLLERDDLDAVYVPLPVALRREWVTRALTRGLHVLSEKPLTTDHAGALELSELALRHRRVLRENFAFPHHSQQRRVRELLDSGTIGRPRCFSSEFGVPQRPDDDIRYDPDLGGSALLDVGVYPLRIAQYFLGAQLEVRGAVLHHHPATGVDIGGAVLLADPHGAAAQLSFGIGVQYRNSYTLWGTRGTLSVDRAFTPPESLRPVVRVQKAEGAEDVVLEADHQFGNALGAFASAIASGEDVGAPASVLELAGLVDEVRRVAEEGAGR
ncbi:Gfo/Idh/MocA family oxidoreductase [Nocardiopsis sp. ATB16-24]|uniref:Gfo/Idh/MocA family protein n=1 Tax=Nocardiopsis sp. ATB16-24 TaxID=3019555 RepID=UPI002553B999|nr:Gfo/Idh/MocA family oxidoreductase [Nocardiopsis sp. ATB16-24]